MSDKVLTWEEAVLWLKGQPEEQELVRACFYDDPPKTSAERYYRSTEWKAVQKILTTVPCGNVLDIGAGRGISSYAFARDGWSVTALEPDSSEVVGAGAIRQVIQPGMNITIREERGEQLPFADNSFDLVYGRAVLHHADNLANFCMEASRVLKPGGVFLFTREHVLSKPEDLDQFFDSHALHSLYQGEYAYILSEYLEALENSRMPCTKILPPYSSDINLFPSSQQEVCKRVRKANHLPLPDWYIKRVFIPKMNKNNNSPGRLYSFWGKKI